MWDIPLNVLLGVLAGAKLIGVFLVWLAWRTYQRNPVQTPSRMVGLTGKALTDITGEGRVMVQGEYWWARARTPIAQGESIRVVAIEGMLLEVESCPDKRLVPRAVSAIAETGEDN